MMLPRIVVYALGLALAAALAVAAVLTKQRNDARAAQARANLDVVNERAAADTTRELYRDSLTRVVERLVVQTPQTSDATDRLLGRQRVALDSMRAAIRALAAHVTSTGGVVSVATAAGGGDSVRRASFDVRQEPYTAHADVELPARGRGRLALSVTLDTIPLTVRPSCAAPDANGIRAARVSVSAPAWASVQLARVEQSADVCRSPALERAGAIDAARRDRRLRLALVAGYGLASGMPRTSGAPLVEGAFFVGVGIAKPIPLPRWLPFR